MVKMSAIFVVVSAAAALLWRVSSLGAGELATHPNLDNAAVESAVKHLRSAKRGSDLEVVRAGIALAIESVGDEHFAARMLTTAESETQSDLKRLQNDVDRVIESLTFRPWMESSLPVGFPKFTPVHHIEVKRLPEYRMARASMPATQGWGGNGAFWKLFSHIKRNDIAMTAPVQMDYTGSDDDAEIKSMSFLYGSMEIGVPGNDSADSSVEVVDIPEQHVVSLGVRGRMTPESVANGHRALLDWLSDHEYTYRPSGPLRRMGYNSPFVPQDRAYFELQVPVEKVQTKQTAG